jgi:hypothetical protein
MDTEPNKLPALPERIRLAVAEKGPLELRLQAIQMTNTYGQTTDFLIELNTQKIQVERRLAELNGQISRWIEEGRSGPRGLI